MFQKRFQNHFIALAGFVALAAAFSSAHGQTGTIGQWTRNVAGNQSWSTTGFWQGGLVPQASGDIANFTFDIVGNQVVTLGGTQTIGTLNLGDLSSNQTYTIGQLATTDLLSFDNQTWGGVFNLGGRAALNKVQGGADTIADVLLVSDLAIYNRVAFTIAGAISDGGSSKSLLKLGTSNLTLTGANSYSGDTIIYTTGGTTLLNTVGFNAINSPLIRLGNSTRDGNVQTFLTLGRSDQINDGTVIRFDGRSGAEPFFRLNGFNETIQGISDYTTFGVIENVNASTPSTLTLNMGATDSFYNAYLRNGSTAALSLVKNGTGTLTLALGRVSYTGATTVNGGTLALNNVTAFNSAVNLNGATTDLTLQATADWRMPQAITGTGSVSRETGANTVSLQAVNTYTGATSIKNGTLRIGAFRTNTADAATLVGAGARITATSAITISANGILNIANRSDGNNADRINSAPISMQSGGITFTNNGTAGINYTETLGAVTLTGGASTFLTGKIHLDTGTPTPPTPADAASSVLTLTSLTRNATATVNFTSTTLGPALGTSAANRIMITAAPALDDGIIGAWATVGNEWAAYDGTNGVTTYAGYNTGAFGTWNPASNVKITGGNQTLGAANITINSLNLQDTTARTLALNGRELTMAAGGILSSGANHVIGTNNGLAGALKASTWGPGAGFNEMIINVGDTNARTLTIFAQIADTGTGTTLVKTGGGTLILNPAAGGNTYRGGTTINGGSIEIKNFDGLGLAAANNNPSFLVMDGGALELAANSNITIPASGTRQITVGGKGGRFEIDLNETFTIANGVPITGPGGLTLGGADATGGTINLNGVLSMQGGLTVTTGTVNLNNASNSFSGGLTISNGTLAVPVTGALPDGLAWNLTGGTLNFLDGPTSIVSSLSGGANGRIEVDLVGGSLGTGWKPMTLIVDQKSDTTYAGTLVDHNYSGTPFGSKGSILNFIKTGSGTLTLSSDASTYLGTTSIEAGILAVTALNYYTGTVTTASSIGVGFPQFFPDSADALTIRAGAALSYVGSLPSFTDRSFTIGTGPEAGALYANGTVVGAKLIFTEFVGEQVKFDAPDVGSTFTLGGRNTGNNVFGLKLTDNGTGYLSLVKTGPGTWILDNLNGSNDYSGSTTIYEGRLAVTGDGAFGKKGQEGPPVQLVGGVLDLRNVNYTASAGQTEDLIMAGGRLDTSVGTSSWAGKINITSNFGPNINVGRDAQLTLGNIDGIGIVDKDSFGTLVMSGVNTYTGSTRIRDGKLVLDYSTAPGDNKLANSNTLALGGGRVGATVELRNTSGTTVTEVVTTLQLDRGQHQIVLDDPATPNPGQIGSVKLQFSNISRAVGGLIDFEKGGLAATNFNNVVPNDVNSILGSWATVAHTDWARKDAVSGILGDIVPVTNYAINTWQIVSPSNTDVQSSNTQTSATTNTLRFNQASTPITITLNGVNTINAGGILMTPNVGVGATNQIQGGTLTVGPTAGNELIIQQFSQNAGLVIGSVIANNPALSGNPPIGLEKLGPGTLTLTGANTYTGVTTIADGTLRVSSLGNGGAPSPLGAASFAAANLVLGGGTLEYTGNSIVTNRGFTVKDFGAFNVGDEDMTVTISGDATTANVGAIVGDSGTAVWDKTGAGTLRLLRLEASGGASGIQELNVADGRLVLEYGYSTTPLTPAVPAPPNATDRLFNTNANLTVSGGTLELVGDDFVFGNGQSFQRFFGQFSVGAGASQIKVTSQTSLAAPLVTQATNLGIGDTNSPLPILRDLGGTVLFVENPNGGVARITVSTVAVDQGVVIPWATYQNTADTGQPGVNNFAAIEQTDDGIVSADSKSLYATKSDPVNWINNGLEHISEEGATPYGGAPVTNGNVATLRFFSNAGAGTITVASGSTLTLAQGAILMAYNSRNNVKTLTGGQLTSSYSTGDGQSELILHNYNTGNSFVLGSQIVDYVAPNFTNQVNLVHTGTGTTSLQAANTYTGITLVTGGVLKLDNANAIPGGVATFGGTSAITLDGGQIGLTSSSGDFTRALGTGTDQVQWTSSGGFAAYGVDRNVNIGGSGSPSIVSWGRFGFVPSGDTLVLGSQDSDKKITFMNPIDLGVADRLVRVENGRAAEDAVLSGVLTGDGSLTKNGEGALRLTATNLHTAGTTLAEGTLFVPSASVLGTGPLSVGTTGNTEANDAPVLVLEGGSIPNLLTVGGVNTVGITTIEVPNDVTLTGAVTVEKTGLFLGPDSGRALTVNAAVSGSGSLRLVDGGTLKLNVSNSYGSGAGVGGAGTAIDGGTIVRNGTVQISNSTALGDGTKALELGDARVAAITVDRATTGAALNYSQGRFDPNGNGLLGSVNGIGAFYGVSNQLDGATYTAADANIDQNLAKKILVKDQFDNPEQNGVYYIYSVDTVAGTMNLARVATSFPQSPVQSANGQQITVANGTVNGGTSFFLAATVDPAKYTDGDGPLNTDPFYWKVETSLNPNVAFTIDAALAAPVTNPIDINATNGTGTTSISFTGNVLHGTTTLSGPVTLQSQTGSPENKDLILSAGGGAELIFSGAVTDPGATDTLNLVKNGTGVVTLAGTNDFNGTTTINAGVLKLDNASALGAANAGSGNVNLNGGVIGLTTNSGNFNRALGTGTGQLQWTAAASGGFAAYGTNQTATVSSGAALTWGTTSQFLTTGSLVLGAPTATAMATFTNPIAFGTTARTVNVPNGPAAVEGELSGVLSGGAGGTLNKTGQGALLLSGINTYTAATNLIQGTLQGKRTTSGSVFGSGAGAVINVGTTAATQTGDALKLEFLGDTGVTPGTYSVSAVNAITIGTNNTNGISSIDATNGNAAATVVDVDVLGTVNLGRRTFIGPDANAIMQFSAAVSGANGSITVVDGGTVRLNVANTYGSGVVAPSGTAINGTTIIRSGTIELSSATATVGSGTIELGDARTNIAVTVDRASGGMALTDNGAAFSAGTFTGVATDFGGGSYTAANIGNTFLLVKDENANPERNGIYQITAVTGTDMTLSRVTQFDAPGEMLYGSTVQVTNGPVPGQNYFMASPTVTTVNTSPVIWRDTVANPNVALLASVAMTINNNIDLNASGSTGTTTLGAVSTLTNLGVANAAVTFGGTVIMQSQNGGAESLILDITSSAIQNTATGVTFSNAISVNAVGADTLQVRKVGTGVATLANTAGNTYNGGTLVNEGVLLVNNTTGSGTGTGPVTVSGNGTVLGGTGSIAGLTTLSATSGNTVFLQPGTGISDANTTFDSATESLAFSGGLTLGAGSKALFQLNGTGKGSSVAGYDLVNVTGGTLTFDSTASIQVVLFAGFNPVNGNAFDLFDWATVPVTDGNLVDQLSLPALSGGLFWDTSTFNSNGTISVTNVVPEPSRILLLLVGAMIGLFRRRRSRAAVLA